MTAIIDLDQISEPDAAPAPTAEMSFRTWLDGWAPRHPAAIGIATGVAVAIVATIAGLLVLVLRPPAPTPPAPPDSSARHQISIGAPSGSGVDLSKTVVYRDSTGDLVLRGDDAAGIVTDEAASFDNIAAVTVTVRAADASCVITVDGRVVDQAQGSGAATCIWVAPPPSR
jgi:hypothetical protein